MTFWYKISLKFIMTESLTVSSFSALPMMFPKIKKKREEKRRDEKKRKEKRKKKRK